MSRTELFKSLMSQLDLGDTVQSWINGAARTGEGETIVMVDPFNTEIISEYPDAGSALVDDACEAAKNAQQQWMSQFSAYARGQVMQDISRAILSQSDALAKLEALVAGKPVSDCRVEVAKVAEMFGYYAGWTDKLIGEVIPVPSGHLNYTLREPLGVVFQITPWNAPIFTGGWQIAPAIATGNGVVIKPSELTPVTTVALAAIAESAGLPKGLINVLCGLGPSTGQAAITNDIIRKVIFVGSPATGRSVATIAAQSLKPVVLELGGKSANIVFADANLRHACLGAQAAIFSGAGQSCVAGSRLLVQRSVQDEFVAMLQEGMNKIQLGDPLDNNTQIGPICNQRQLAYVKTMINTAEQDGATVLTRDRTPDQGFFVAPTILNDIDNNAHAAQNEIFGPVVSIVPFDDEEQAITLANDCSFGLAGAVWTTDVGRAHRVASKVRAGTFWVNSYKAIHVSSPFGGSLSSGFGRSSGSDGLAEYTQSKSVWLDSAETPRIAFGYVS